MRHTLVLGPTENQLARDVFLDPFIEHVLAPITDYSLGTDLTRDVTHTVAIGAEGLRQLLLIPRRAAGQVTVYLTLDGTNVNQAMLSAIVSADNIVCPSRDWAKELANTLQRHIKVVELPAVSWAHPCDPRKRDFSPGELKHSLLRLTPDTCVLTVLETPPVEQLGPLLTLLAECNKTRHTHLLMIGDGAQEAYRAKVRAASEWVGVETSDLSYMPYNRANVLYCLHASDVVVTTPGCAGWGIELSQSAGVIAAVPDIALWADRVDQQRGAELPTLTLCLERPVLDSVPVLDPSRAVDVLRQLTVKETVMRRMNAAARIANPGSSWATIGAQWQSLFNTQT